MTGGTRSLRISRTHFPVTALGPGVRLGVWVQGCPLACRGCLALDTWDPGAGTEIEVADLAERWREAIGRGATGLTISGGEPLAQPVALGAFLDEVERVNAASPTGDEYDVLLYTGYEPAEFTAAQAEVADRADVIVTGRFEAGSPTDRIWRGSANQTMVLRSDLARRRYARYLDHEPENPPIQVSVDDAGVWIVGVPRRGALAEVERTLRATGIGVERVSWRPSR